MFPLFAFATKMCIHNTVLSIEAGARKVAWVFREKRLNGRRTEYRVHAATLYKNKISC